MIPRALRVLIAVLIAALSAVLFGAIAFTPTAAAAQNGVGASTPVMINTVGSPADIGAGQRLGKSLQQPSFMVATGVAAESETELVQRAMSQAELQATEESGLVRGGREGTNYVSDNVNTDALRARQRLALPETPEVRVTLEVPRGAFSPPKLVDPRFGMPGGGMERMGTGQIACRVVAVQAYC